MIFPVYEFRPLPKDIGGKVYRYAKGKWILDDGEYDLAFAVMGFIAPMCYYVDLPYWSNQLWAWAKDGNWSAHVSKHPKGNAWHYMYEKEKLSRPWGRHNHPNTLAAEEGMRFVSNKAGCANGAGPEFYIGNEYIKQGLLREKTTRKVVKFPKVFNCIYCGKLKTSEDKRLR